MKWFNPDSPIMAFLATLWDFFVLNLIALLCALPIVTAGASFAALSEMMRVYVMEKTPLRAREFFGRFRACFFRATICWLILLSIVALFALDMRITADMPSALRLASVSALLFFLLCTLLCAAFLFPMLGLGASEPLPALGRRALITAVAKLPRSLAMLAVQLTPVFLFLLSARTFLLLLPFWITLWFSLAAFLSAKIGGRWYVVS